MLTNNLYHTWIRRIRELRPDQRITQIRNSALLLCGIYARKSVTLRDCLESLIASQAA